MFLTGDKPIRVSCYSISINRRIDSRVDTIVIMLLNTKNGGWKNDESELHV